MFFGLDLFFLCLMMRENSFLLVVSSLMPGPEFAPLPPFYSGGVGLFTANRSEVRGLFSQAVSIIFFPLLPAAFPALHGS